MTGAGALLWAVKDSFLEYVRALDDGEISVSRGAKVVEDRFEFPRESGPAGAVLRFVGTAALRGHAYLLSTDVRDPWIEFENDDGVVTISGPRDGAPRFTIARFSGVERGQSVWRIQPTLTTDGAYWLGGYYTEGSQLAPIAIRLR